MISGNVDSKIGYYENTDTTTSPSFVQQTSDNNLFADISPDVHVNPLLIDLDNDGIISLISGNNNGTIIEIKQEMT